MLLWHIIKLPIEYMMSINLWIIINAKVGRISRILPYGLVLNDSSLIGKFR